MAIPGSYSLKWHGHGVHLNSSISGLYRSDAFTDVVLATTDGRYFSAHQFVLSACSRYLHKMFLVGSNSPKTSAKIVVVLPSEISHSTLNILLQYIYKGESIVNHDQLPSIMRAAEILEIRGLYPGKDKPQDPKATNNRMVLKQQNKNSSEPKNSVEPSKSNHKVVIPEVNYGLEANEAIINHTNSEGSNSFTNIIKRTPAGGSVSPERKKQKVIVNNSELAKEKDNTSNLDEDSMIERLIVGEEIQVKEEPVYWEENYNPDENDSIVKQEMATDEEVEVDNNYVPLTCDLCQETFTTPSLWVRHINQAHPTTALAAGKRGSTEENNTMEYPPLHCELCQQVFTVPAEWVRHIQSHTEQQLAHNNDTVDNVPATRSSRLTCTCPICGKVLQSQASMQIHARTHTGERPYLCKLCGREFNVKSNFLRHLRTLHDQLVNSNDVE